MNSKHFMIFPWITLIILGTLIMSCSSRITQSPLPSSILSSPTNTVIASSMTPKPSKTIAHTKTSTPTSVPPTLTHTFLPSETPIPTQTWTPLPTLDPESAQNLVTQLMKTNRDCKLPCWWGISPGETTWDIARHFLESFTTSIVQGSSNGSTTNYRVNYKLSQDSVGAFMEIRVIDEVVSRIVVVSNGTNLNYQLDKVLTVYGEPDEIFMLYGWMGEVGVLQLYLVLFYPTKGIFAEYLVESEVVNNMYRSCPQGVGPELWLWSSDKEMTFAEGFGSTDDFVRLEDITDMNKTSFYEKFKDFESQPCLEVQQE